MSIEKLTTTEDFPAEKGQGKLVAWIRDKIYFKVSQRINWLLDRIGNNSDFEIIEEGNSKGEDGNWCLKIVGTDLVIERKTDSSTGAVSVTNNFKVDTDVLLVNAATDTVSVNGTFKSGDGGATDYSEFEPDGTLKFNGAAIVWDDLRVPVSSVRVTGPGGTFPPAETAYKGGFVLAFEDAAINEESISFTAQLPHSYKEGTDIDVHIHWVPEDNSAGNVAWTFTHSWANINAAFPGETSVDVTTAAGEVTDKHQLDDIATLDGTGKTISSMLICSLKRNSSDASDTYNGLDAYLLEVDFHFQIDTVGSRTEMAK